MSVFTRPTVRFDPAAGDSSPIEAKLESDGRVRIASDPDSGRLNGAWLTPAEAREFATELLGLADASDAIHDLEA
jgi:hypothetical protein